MFVKKFVYAIRQILLSDDCNYDEEVCEHWFFFFFLIKAKKDCVKDNVNNYLFIKTMQLF